MAPTLSIAAKLALLSAVLSISGVALSAEPTPGDGASELAGFRLGEPLSQVPRCKGADGRKTCWRPGQDKDDPSALEVKNEPPILAKAAQKTGVGVEGGKISSIELTIALPGDPAAASGQLLAALQEKWSACGEPASKTERQGRIVEAVWECPNDVATIYMFDAASKSAAVSVSQTQQESFP